MKDQKFITIGEIMLRLTPPNYEKIRMASVFEASYGGSEANIALALANLDKVSTNLSLDDIMALIPALPAMRGAQLRQLRVPVDGGYKNQTVAGMAVLVPDRTKNKRAISEFLTE